MHIETQPMFVAHWPEFPFLDLARVVAEVEVRGVADGNHVPACGHNPCVGSQAAVRSFGSTRTLLSSRRFETSTLRVGLSWLTTTLLFEWMDNASCSAFFLAGNRATAASSS